MQFSPNIILAMPDRISQHPYVHLIPASHYGFDREGAPIYWERTGYIQSQWDEVKKHFTVDELIQYHIQSQEGCEIRLKYASAKFGKLITKAVTVFDMKHLTISLDASAILYIKLLLQIDQDNYPERLKTLYIINAPWYFQLFYKIFKPFIDKKTADKFVILGDDYLLTMERQIDMGMIPLEMGGKAKDVVWCGPFPEHTGLSDDAVIEFIHMKYNRDPGALDRQLRPEEVSALTKAVAIAAELGLSYKPKEAGAGGGVTRGQSSRGSDGSASSELDGRAHRSPTTDSGEDSAPSAVRAPPALRISAGTNTSSTAAAWSSSSPVSTPTGAARDGEAAEGEGNDSMGRLLTCAFLLHIGFSLEILLICNTDVYSHQCRVMYPISKQVAYYGFWIISCMTVVYLLLTICKHICKCIYKLFK